MTEDSRAPSALIADDDEISRVFLTETLEQAGMQVVAVADGAAALAAATRNEFCVALLDVNMPLLDGYEVCCAMRAVPRLKHLPVVMITGRDDAKSIARAFDAGATDFISKPVNWTLLPHRIRYILRNADADQRLRYLAYHDELTGLPNTQALLNLVADSISAAATNGEGVAIVQIDVDACSRIRSMFGPDAGDEALRALARILKQSVLSTNDADTRVIIARIDGDRFVICVRDGQAELQAAELSRRIAAALDAPVQCAGHQFFLRPIFGIALYPEHGVDAKILLTHAATAKHHAVMTESQGAVTYTSQIGARARQRLELGAALREAVRTEQLSLAFQPKIRLSDLSLYGVEALLRWNDPLLGQVSPSQFIPLAEESDLILDIGKWMVQSVCRQLQNWKTEGFFTMAAINVSGKEFLHADPARTIMAAAAEASIDTACLTIEITESSLIRDLAQVQTGLRALRALGCKISIDDFGTGYSSLTYLKGLPVDELKLDRSFIKNVDSDYVDGAICVAILSLARDLGLSVTAEGVENQPQLQWLRDRACHNVQGYFLARPMPAHEILRAYGASKASNALTG